MGEMSSDGRALSLASVSSSSVVTAALTMIPPPPADDIELEVAQPLEIQVEEMTGQLQLLRNKLKRRNILVDELRRTYLRDVTTVRQVLKEQGIEAGTTFDLRPTLSLFAPAECAFQLAHGTEETDKVGGHIEVIHRESKRVAALSKKCEELLNLEQDARLRSVEMESVSEKDRFLLIQVKRESREEREILSEEIEKLKARLECVDENALEGARRNIVTLKRQLDEATKKVDAFASEVATARAARKEHGVRELRLAGCERTIAELEKAVAVAKKKSEAEEARFALLAKTLDSERKLRLEKEAESDGIRVKLEADIDDLNGSLKLTKEKFEKKSISHSDMALKLSDLKVEYAEAVSGAEEETERLQEALFEARRAAKDIHTGKARELRDKLDKTKAEEIEVARAVSDAQMRLLVQRGRVKNLKEELEPSATRDMVEKILQELQGGGEAVAVESVEEGLEIAWIAASFCKAKIAALQTESEAVHGRLALYRVRSAAEALTSRFKKSKKNNNALGISEVEHLNQLHDSNAEVFGSLHAELELTRTERETFRQHRDSLQIDLTATKIDLDRMEQASQASQQQLIEEPVHVEIVHRKSVASVEEYVDDNPVERTDQADFSHLIDATLLSLDSLKQLKLLVPQEAGAPAAAVSEGLAEGALLLLDDAAHLPDRSDLEKLFFYDNGKSSSFEPTLVLIQEEFQRTFSRLEEELTESRTTLAKQPADFDYEAQVAEIEEQALLYDDLGLQKESLERAGVATEFAYAATRDDFSWARKQAAEAATDMRERNDAMFMANVKLTDQRLLLETKTKDQQAFIAVTLEENAELQETSKRFTKLQHRHGELETKLKLYSKELNFKTEAEALMRELKEKLEVNLKTKEEEVEKLEKTNKVLIVDFKKAEAKELTLADQLVEMTATRDNMIAETQEKLDSRVEAGTQYTLETSEAAVQTTFKTPGMTLRRINCYNQVPSKATSSSIMVVTPSIDDDYHGYPPPPRKATLASLTNTVDMARYDDLLSLPSGVLPPKQHQLASLTDSDRPASTTTNDFSG